MRDLVQPRTYDYLRGMSAVADLFSLDMGTALNERRRLQRVWSHFFNAYPVVVGPTWTQLPWPIDADLKPKNGVQLLFDTIRFITPGNTLGIPGVALPMGVADGLATGIQIYADLYRDDLALMVVEIIEADRGPCPTPIDPVPWPPGAESVSPPTQSVRVREDASPATPSAGPLFGPHDILERTET